MIVQDMPPIVPIKSIEERQAIVLQTYGEIARAGFGSDAYPAVQALKEILRAYATNGEDQAGFSGQIPFPEAGEGCKFVYQLPMRASSKAFVELVKPPPPSSSSSSTSVQGSQNRNGMRRTRRLTKAQQELQQQKQLLRQTKQSVQPTREEHQPHQPQQSSQSVPPLL